MLNPLSAGIQASRELASRCFRSILRPFAPMSEDATSQTTSHKPTTPEAEGPGVQDSNAALAELQQKLDQAQLQSEESQSRFLRAVADLENFRKRSLREKDEARRYGAAGLAESLIPVIDNYMIGLESARKHEAGQVFIDGFAMILSQLRQALTENGIQELNPVGEAFDPHRHESLAQQPSDQIPEGHVVLVQRVGYLLHDRLLRPASVVVSSGPAQTTVEA